MVKETPSFCIEAVNRFILEKQHLNENSKIDDIVQIARDLGGLHATNPSTPFLSLLARANLFDKDSLLDELYKHKSLSKVTYVRRTMFILPKDMLPVAFAAVRKNASVMTEQHLKYLGMTQKEYDKTARQILSILKDNGSTLNELKEKIGAIPHLTYVVRMMCFQGLLIRGAPKAGWKSSLHTYFPMKQYYPDFKTFINGEKEAQRYVVDQYIANYGPVCEKDIFWWTGFLKTPVRAILDDMQERLSTVAISGLEGPFFLLASQEGALRDIQSDNTRTVNILPCLDPYLMGFKYRDRYIDTDFFSYIFDRSGNATKTILHEGKVIGIWDFESPLFKYFLFHSIEKEVLKKIKDSARKVGQFLCGRNVQMKECTDMKPLTKRTAGGVMSPLKDS